MSASVAASPISLVVRLWRDPATWVTTADIFAVLTALALPWSTSLVAIFVLCWLGAVAWVMDYRIYFQSLKRPICFLPFALVGLAIVGTLWSDAPWAARLYAISPTAKLLVLPALFYHFERSARGMWVLIAFLVSCTLLLAMSWIVVFDPGLTLKLKGEEACGIFVKNHIDQGQEFALCAVALAYPLMILIRKKNWLLAALLAAIALGFVVNMGLVIAARTAMATMPIMLLAFALLHLKWRSIVVLSIIIVIAGLAWTRSPQLCRAIQTLPGGDLPYPSVSRDYQLYVEENVPTSTGLRLEFWRKSLRFFAEAPVFGHGTGSTRGLFEQAATGSSVSAAAQVIGNPHNQTLNVAVQWGLLGVVILYAMWLSHLLLFRGDGLATWIGLLVVLQNVATSLFNSHIFDFHEGWMYVLGVGVAGGMTFRARNGGASSGPVKS